MSKNVVSRCLIPLLCSALASSALAYASRIVPPSAQPGIEAHDALSPRDYYRGIVFKYGPLAQQLKSIDDHFAAKKFLDQELYTKYVEQTEKILDELESSDPSLLPRFQEAAVSGDHVRIQNAINEAATTLTNYLRDKNPDLSDSDALSENGRCAVFFLAVAVVVGVVVETGAWVHLATALWEHLGPLSMTEGNVLRDQMIDDIAVNLVAP